MSAADPVTPEPRLAIPLPRWGWLLMAVVVLIVVTIGLQLGIPIYRQHLLVQEVERAGGTVSELRPRGPAWLRRRLGAELLAPIDQVIGITLSDSVGTDAKLSQIRKRYLADLQFVWLDNAQVSDAGLVHLKGLTRLEFLCLDNTKVTDDGLTHLKELTSLRDLWLSNTRVTDAGVAKLQRELPSLTIYH